MLRDNRCMYMAHTCFYFMSVVATVWGSVGMFVVYRPLLKIVFYGLGVLKYVVFSVCIVTRGAVCARVWMFRHADGVCLCLVCILW